MENKNALIQDLLKYSTIAFIMNLLYFIMNPNKNTFFSPQFFALVLFLCCSLATYWLIVEPLTKEYTSDSIPSEVDEQVEEAVAKTPEELIAENFGTFA